eukprot:4900435-Pyramimonas_sp.AAC.1
MSQGAPGQELAKSGALRWPKHCLTMGSPAKPRRPAHAGDDVPLPGERGPPRPHTTPGHRSRSTAGCRSA